MAAGRSCRGEAYESSQHLLAGRSGKIGQGTMVAYAEQLPKTGLRRIQPAKGRREPTLLAGLIYNSIIVLAILPIWWIATSTGMIEPFFLPAPEAVLSEALKLSISPAFWYNLGTSLFRIIAGF